MKVLITIGCVLFCIGFSKAQIHLSDTAKIPVLAWGGVPPDEASVARYEEMKAAGLTISLTRSTSIDTMKMMLDKAQRAGVKLIVRCPELETGTENTVRYFMHHPATAGYYLKDEPPASEFEHLAAWASRIRTVDSLHFCYLNLLPNYATPAQLGAPSYQEYVREFLSSVPVPFVSFDHYPVIESKGKRSLRKEWFENLEIIAEESRKANKPFWAFALSVAHAFYPIPTLPELRLQVYSNLAYGAQGIQYFTYWTPKNKSQYVYHSGPIDDSKQKTAVYDMLKELNAEIQNLSGVFLSSKVISVEHIGKEIPVGTHRMSKLPEGIKKIKIRGEGAIVSVLEKGNSRFIIVVNKDFVNPMKLNIKGSSSSLEKVLKNGNIVRSKSTSSVQIDPGDVAIYRQNNIIKSLRMQ